MKYLDSVIREKQYNENSALSQDYFSFYEQNFNLSIVQAGRIILVLVDN